MKLLPGDLVKVSPIWGDQPVNLQSQMAEALHISVDQNNRMSYVNIRCGVINVNDVCIVISVDRSYFSSIYLMGPGGLGWVLETYLTNLLDDVI